LIAENDRACAQWLKLHLERAGFGVFVAYDGEQAAILVARQRFELVIANLDLPIINGIELLRHIRDELGLTEIPVAICVGNDVDSELENLADDDNYIRVFQKPVDPSAVVDFAQEAVEYLVSSH
jgi:DNA-binding response OmpR family regulator